MQLVPPSLPRSSYVPSSFGLYCSSCFGNVFVSILCRCGSPTTRLALRQAGNPSRGQQTLLVKSSKGSWKLHNVISVNYIYTVKWSCLITLHTTDILSHHSPYYGHPVSSPSILWTSCLITLHTMDILSHHPPYYGHTVSSSSILRTYCLITLHTTNILSHHPPYYGHTVSSPSIPRTSCLITLHTTDILFGTN
jgi:hypothetical protein